jgi:hypothetical protein
MSHRYDDYNPLHKDKNNLNLKTNTRYNNRNLLDIQINKDFNQSTLNRMNIERQQFMKNSYLEDDNEDDNEDDYNINNDNNDNDNYNNNEVELIPNNGFDPTIGRGMPYRSEVNIRKNMHHQNINPNNIIRNDLPTKQMNAFDPFENMQNNNFNFSDVKNDTKISPALKVDALCTENINTLSVFFIKNLIKILRTPFHITPYNIYSIFASLYLGSAKNTEVELKNYFQFPKKELLLEGFTEIDKNLLNNSSHIKCGGCILFNSELPVNPAFCSYFESLSKIRKIDRNQTNNECNTINNIVNQLTQNAEMKKSVSQSCLNDINVLLLTYSYSHPTLLINNFQNNVGTFNSMFNGQVNVNYLTASNQVFGTIETENMKILELCCENNEIMYGMILLNNNDFNFSKKELIDSTKNLKPMLFNTIQFPQFNIKTKLKLKNILKTTDMQTIFLDLNCPELFSGRTKLDEVLQNSEIKIGGKFKKVKEPTQQFKASKNFIINRSFVYYLRLRKTNTLISVGVF